MKVSIIGGGASGVLCALRIKYNNPLYEVVIFESNDLLRKVKMSGNGRCNLTNNNIKPDCYSNGKLISEMLAMGYEKESLAFFRRFGLVTYSEDDRVYPYPNQALNVVKILERNLFYNHIDLRLNTQVKKVNYKNNKYYINDLKEEFDYVVISIGSNAYLTNDLVNYSLIKDLNIKMNEVKPALVGFKINNYPKELFGIRSKVKASYLNHESSGELIFKEDGISGICIMDLSMYFDKMKDKTISIDLLPDFSIVDLLSFTDEMTSFDPNIKLHNLLAGALNLKLLQYLNSTIDNTLVKNLSKEYLTNYFDRIKNFKLEIKDTYDFTKAQVVKGGINTHELDLFRVKKYPNLFATGEVIDECGKCGGYNLWFAFTSGIMVADLITKVR